MTWILTNDAILDDTVGNDTIWGKTLDGTNNKNLSQNRPLKRQSPEDGVGDGRRDGQTDSPCVQQDFVPFRAAALLPLNLNHTLLKQGTGTADHLLPVGCY